MNDHQFKDPDALYDDAAVAIIALRIYGSKQIRIKAEVGDNAVAINLVDHARAKIAERLAVKSLKPAAVFAENEVVAELTLVGRRNGAMDIQGNIYDDTYALLMVDHMREKIRSHVDRKHLEGGKGILIKPQDSGIAA
jgi:hypothetical protein